jgi:hypothetical protein
VVGPIELVRVAGRARTRARQLDEQRDAWLTAKRGKLPSRAGGIRLASVVHGCVVEHQRGIGVRTTTALEAVRGTRCAIWEGGRDDTTWYREGRYSVEGDEGWRWYFRDGPGSTAEDQSAYRVTIDVDPRLGLRTPIFLVGPAGVVEEITGPGASARVVFDPVATLRELQDCVKRSRARVEPSAWRFEAVLIDCPWLTGRLRESTYRPTDANVDVFVDASSTSPADRIVVLSVRVVPGLVDPRRFHLQVTFKAPPWDDPYRYVEVDEDGTVYDTLPTY